jgi:signal recognition particle GTPase
MEELKKIKRVMGKLMPPHPHEVLLVVDASTGQNALNQAVQFHEAVGVTGLILTKLDGTAKGGIVFAIARRLGLPIRFIGVGESIEDLRAVRRRRICRRPAGRRNRRLKRTAAGTFRFGTLRSRVLK